MTALETLIINSLDIATLGAGLSSLAKCLDSVDDEPKWTTIVCSVTTTLNNIEVPNNIMIVRDAQSYVESMSTEELIALDNMLAEKGLTFSEENQDGFGVGQAKVYTKQGPKQQL